MRLPAAWFPKTPIASVAVAIALVLPYGETRLYHDRFNLSGATDFFGASPLPAATAMGFAAATLFGRPGELVRPYPTAVKERAPVGSLFVAVASWRASSYSVVEWAL